jgi:hypothetical protein
MEDEEPKLPAGLLAKAFGVRCIVWLDLFGCDGVMLEVIADAVAVE